MENNFILLIECKNENNYIPELKKKTIVYCN